MQAENLRMAGVDEQLRMAQGEIFSSKEMQRTL